MSVIATGAAAGVAATAHQAVQVARRDGRDRRESDTAARQVRDKLEASMLSLDDGPTQSASSVNIDQEMPDNPSPEYHPPESPTSEDQEASEQAKMHGDVEDPSPDGTTPIPPTATTPDDPPPLYRHLDITA